MLVPINPYADLLTTPTDSNTAFYESDSLNYLFQPPNGFRLVMREAAMDGYSFAFIPEDQAYDTALVFIPVTIFNLKASRGQRPTFAEIVADDTTGIRDQYGPGLQMWPVDSIFCGDGSIIPTVYTTAEREFIPTVMASYFDGGDEVIMIEMVISDRFPRFKAEPIYEQMVWRFKPLKKRSLVDR